VDLVSERLRLRAARAADFARLGALQANPEVARFAGSPMLLPESVHDRQALFQAARASGDLVRWVIEPKGADAIGTTSLMRFDHLNRHCWFGIWIGPPENWGRGYGTEACLLATRFAFRQLGMAKVYLGYYAGNERGRRSYEKAGYQLEATLPRDHLMEGELVTTHLMAAYADNPLYA